MNFSDIPVFLIAPFVLLLGMIATGPVLYARFWHRYYGLIAIGLASVVVGYYVVVMHSFAEPIEALVDYLQFIALIGSLYVTSGGILIDIDTRARFFINVVVFWTGAVLSNVIGTTGASMLLIRPFIRINRKSMKAYHVVFFIFMVSNIGGSLTPVGDPPLFLGFLKGVPFFWTVRHCFLPWFTALTLLSMIFYVLDRYYQGKASGLNGGESLVKIGIRVEGKKNFIFLMLIVLAVFIDPAIFSWVPAISFHGHDYSFVREIMFLAIGIASYVLADKEVLRRNAFSVEPLKEVLYLFFGIFGTMIPTLALINAFARSKMGQGLISPHTLYWGVGTLSAFLDNAPTYLTALQAGKVAEGYASVVDYAEHSVQCLKATSVGAVFFGAMSYIGNGPNYMVQKIAEESGVKMPSFFGYLMRYSIPFLLPVLLIVWLLFFFL